MTVEEVAARKGKPVGRLTLEEKREAHAAVIPGGDLINIEEKDLDEILMYHSEIVFARTSPQQKLIIVEGCQRMGCLLYTSPSPRD